MALIRPLVTGLKKQCASGCFQIQALKDDDALAGMQGGERLKVYRSPARCDA